MNILGELRVFMNSACRNLSQNNIFSQSALTLWE